MNNTFWIIISVIITFFLIVIESLLVYLFPHLDIMGFFMIIFLMFFIPIGAGVGIFSLQQYIKNKKKALLITGIVLLALCMQISLHPSRTNVWVEIYRYSSVLVHYPGSTTYDDLAFGNEQEQVAASVKYRSSLPDRIAVITYEEKRDSKWYVSEKYFVELRNNEVYYDQNKFLLVETEKYLLFITNPGGPNRVEYELEHQKIDRLFDLYSGASFPFNGGWVSFSAHEFKLTTGAEKLFASILSRK
jgi:hypothetical protein